MSTVVIALAGAFVGGFIAELRSWLQIRRDTRRTLRRVLYQQLEVRDAVIRANPLTFLDAFGSVLAKRYRVNPAAAKTELRRHGFFEAAFTQLVSARIGHELESKYEAAVDSLGEIDPLLAFRLAGKAALTRYRERMEAYTAAVVPTPSPNDQAVLDALRPLLDDTVYTKTIQILEEDILDVAGSLGRTIKRSTLRLLEKKLDASAGLELELNAWFDRVETALARPELQS